MDVTSVGDAVGRAVQATRVAAGGRVGSWQSGVGNQA